MQVNANVIMKELMEDLLDGAQSGADRAITRKLLSTYLPSPVPTLDELGRLGELERYVLDPSAELPCGARRSSYLLFARFLRKLDIGQTLRSQQETIASFHTRQEMVGIYDSVPSKLADTARAVLADLLGSCPDDVWAHGVFGPGSTSEGNFGLDKANVPLPEKFSNLDPLGRLVASEPSSVPFTRIGCVPKDWRGSRVIGMEPAWAMAAQLSAKRLLEDALHHVVPFYDQNKQRKLLTTSRVPTATVDLSNASDHVSVTLANELLPSSWFKHLASIRTERHTSLQQSARTESFALMGNGFCFPILSAICFSLTMASHVIATRNSRPRGLSDIMRYKNAYSIQCFGDDIVAPSATYEELLADLTRCGLQVNREKSYSTFFRETCGAYMFDEDSYPFECVYLRTLDAAEGVASLLELCRQADRLGYTRLARALWRTIQLSGWGEHLRIGFSKKLWKPYTFWPMRIARQRRVALADGTGWWHASTCGIPQTEDDGPGSIIFKRNYSPEIVAFVRDRVSQAPSLLTKLSK